MSDWLDTLHEDLKRREVTREDFGRTVQRLLEYGIIWHSDSRIESDLYDVASRIETHLEDYLALMGFRLFHDRTYQYFKAYPPGAEIPVLPDVETDSGGFRKHLKQDEVALALGLRVLYQQKLAEGGIDDDGEAAVSLEEINSLMLSTLNRSMPTGQTEYTNLMHEMRKLRLLRFDSDADIFAGDGWVFIRPAIIATVSEDVLAQIARDHFPEQSEATNAN